MACIQAQGKMLGLLDVMEESVPQGEDGLKPIPTSPCSYILLDAGDESPAYLCGVPLGLVRGCIGCGRSRFPSEMTARKTKAKAGPSLLHSTDEDPSAGTPVRSG